MSKSGDWYKKLRSTNPVEYKKLMDEKVARRNYHYNNDINKFIQMKFVKQRAEAARRNYSWELEKEFVDQLFKNNKQCKLSGLPLIAEINHPDAPSIDRIDNNKGYSIDNVQLVSQRVNKAKSTMTDEEFIIMCCNVAINNKQIFENIILEKENI